MEVLEQVQEQNNQLSQTEGVENEGGAATAPPQQVQVAQEKTGLDKLKEKATSVVADPAATKEKAGEVKAAAAQAVAEAFKPNLKFKAAGKELEVPKFLQGVMKDAETEKYLHSLLSKAHGIEMIQEKLKTTREARDQVTQAYHQVMNPINEAREAYRAGDLDTVFDTLKIDPNKVLQWAVKKVELSQMPPDQRQVHEARIAAERNVRQLQKMQAEQQTQGQDQQAEQLKQMLDLVMERQDVSALAQRYDQKKGKEGSFLDLVVLMGDRAYSTGKLISPLEAAKQAAELLGEKLGAQQEAQQAQVVNQVQAQAVQSAAQTQTEQKKIVLPNVGGSKTASPAKGKVKSIDDIRKLHHKLASQ